MIVLSIILKILLMIIFIFLLLLSLLLFIPLNYLGTSDISNSLQANFQVKLLFNLVKLSASFIDDNPHASISICKLNFNLDNLMNKNPSSHKNKHSKNKNSKSQSKNPINFITCNYKYIRSIINIIKPKYFNINGVLGFDDPFLTGEIIALLNIIIPSKYISVTPIFNEEIIDIKIELSGTIHMYLICYILIKYFFKDKFKIKIPKLSINMKLFKKKECIN